MFKVRVVSLLLLALGACATQSSVKPTDEEARGDLVCHEETPTGKMISTRVCRHRSDVDADRDETQRVLGATGNRPDVQQEQVKPYLPQPKSH
jgi:hypothetical protein